MQRRASLILIAAVVAGILVCWGDVKTGVAADGQRQAALKKDDCIKCHAVVFGELEDGKSKHKTKVSCLECHSGAHPPKSQKGDLIPKCTKCHKDAPHFELANCTNCHHKPHQPKDIVLEGEGQKDACNSCHPAQVTEVNTHITSHTGFACSFCHKQHRDKPNCLTCHQPHAQGQVYKDCIKCHQAHQPLTLAFDTKAVSNNDCGGCHSGVQKTLESGPTKHAKFQCVFCHAEKHGVIPDCTQCHKAPHDKKMIRNFNSCNDCHQSAHDILS